MMFLLKNMLKISGSGMGIQIPPSPPLPLVGSGETFQDRDPLVRNKLESGVPLQSAQYSAIF